MKLKNTRNVLRKIRVHVRQKPYKCGKHWIWLESLIYKGYMVFEEKMITQLCNQKQSLVTWGIVFESFFSKMKSSETDSVCRPWIPRNAEKWNKDCVKGR